MLSQMVEEVGQEKLRSNHSNLFSGSTSVKPLKFGLESSCSSISTNMNSPATYFKVENNVRDATNDASGSILADIEGDSITPKTSSTPRFKKERNG